MGEVTGIEWADHTFNPWEGCTKVNPACDNCYAETRNQRFHGGAHWGPKTPRLMRRDAYWREPLAWDRAAREAGTMRRVFCASLADVFERHPVPEVMAAMDAARDRLWVLIRSTPNLVWMLLTKRPKEVLAMLPGNLVGHPRVWIGTSIPNQYWAERLIPQLEAIDAVVRFVSLEPMLDRVDLSRCGGHYTGSGPLHLWHSSLPGNGGWQKQFMEPPPTIHWVICGGESGPNARPLHADWVRTIRDQCAAAGLPFLFKQWGEWHPDALSYRHALTGECPPLSMKIGKRKSGRELDGRTHDGVPEVFHG